MATHARSRLHDYIQLFNTRDLGHGYFTHVDRQFLPVDGNNGVGREWKRQDGVDFIRDAERKAELATRHPCDGRSEE